MHELSIALGIIDAATEEAERLGASRILAVHMKAGPLSGIVPEALRSAFALAREESLLADAELVIELLPLVAFCPACTSQQAIISIQDLRCAACGAFAPDIIRGRDLDVVALEIES